MFPDEPASVHAVAEQSAQALRTFCSAWALQDLVGALVVIHDDVSYAMYIPTDVVPFGGETRGKPALADRMRTILEQFEMLSFETTHVIGSPSGANASVAYEFRHRVARETLTGTMRLVTRVESGKITSVHEYHDLEKVRAFMRLVAYRAGDPPEHF